MGGGTEHPIKDTANTKIRVVIDNVVFKLSPERKPVLTIFPFFALWVADDA